MKANKIIIGSALILGIGIGSYFLLRRQNGDDPGPSANSYPPGTLLRAGSNDRVYVIGTEGYKHWVASRGKFDSMGYNMSDVKSISKAELDKIPTGVNLSGFIF